MHVATDWYTPVTREKTKSVNSSRFNNLVGSLDPIYSCLAGTGPAIRCPSWSVCACAWPAPGPRLWPAGIPPSAAPPAWWVIALRWLDHKQVHCVRTCIFCANFLISVLCTNTSCIRIPAYVWQTWPVWVVYSAEGLNNYYQFNISHN